MNKIFISHLLSDDEMKEVIGQTGAGVESIEFSISENLDRLPVCISSYRERLERMGAESLILHGPFLDLNPMTFDSRIKKVTFDRYAQAYDAAVRLKAEKIVYHTCLYPEVYLLTGWADRVAEFYQEFLENRTEIEVVMENVHDRKWEPVLDVAEKTDLKNFRLCLDTGHVNCYADESVLIWAKRLKPYLTHIHVHDNLGDRDGHKGIGQGNIPWKELFPLLKNSKDISYTIECSNKEDVLRSFRILEENI